MINGGMLKQFRERAGLSHEQAAVQLGINKRVVQRYEAGDYPRLDLFIRMVEIYDLSPIEMALVLRVTPPGMEWNEMLKFGKSCSMENKSSATVLGEFIRAYNLMMRQ